MKYRIYPLVFICVLLLSGGCKKYLDKKSNQNLSIPDNLEDIELLLNNTIELNGGQAAGNAASDEYYLNSNDWETLDAFNKDSYLWNPRTQADFDWNLNFRTIFIANTALDNLEKIDRSSEPGKWDELKGRALFIRGLSTFQLAQIFAPAYPGNENSSLGLPLRLSADFNKPVIRSTVKETYDQLIADFASSIPLLPLRNVYPTQASRWAAYAMLSRVHLILGNYQAAYDYSDSCLGISSDLINYNSVDVSPEFPLPRFNVEVIYHLATDVPVNAYYWMARVDSTLYKSFAELDLRKKLFFIDNGDGSFGFKGNYTGSYFLFNGIAIDEVYLTKVEAAVRLNKIAEALTVLNTLLRTRWEPSGFDEIDITDQQDLLKVVLQERKKELMFRGLRWADLRRLNNDPNFKTNLKRVINGQEYQLPPADLRYVLLIPQQSINISGIPQNPR